MPEKVVYLQRLGKCTVFLMCIFLILVLEAYLWQHLPVRTEIVKLRMARKKQLHQIRVQEAILQAEAMRLKVPVVVSRHNLIIPLWMKLC